jgi:hypothetical protein
MNSGGYIGDGLTFLLLGAFFVYLGTQQKKPKKIIGMPYLVFASITGVAFMVYGMVDLAMAFIR